MISQDMLTASFPIYNSHIKFRARFQKALHFSSLYYSHSANLFDEHQHSYFPEVAFSFSLIPYCVPNLMLWLLTRHFTHFPIG